MKATFECCVCGKVKSIYVKTADNVICECGNQMRRVFNIVDNKATTVTERKCNIFNINSMVDIEEEIKKRNEEHYWSVIVPDLVKSGNYKISEMLQNGWIYYDEKGQIQIQNKPPHKR